MFPKECPEQPFETIPTYFQKSCKHVPKVFPKTFQQTSQSCPKNLTKTYQLCFKNCPNPLKCIHRACHMFNVLPYFLQKDRVLKHRLLAVSRDPGGLRELRRPGSINFNLSWYFSDFAVRSYSQNPLERLFFCLRGGGSQACGVMRSCVNMCV